jgi:membrane associated rhomboid family serine protease
MGVLHLDICGFVAYRSDWARSIKETGMNTDDESRMIAPLNPVPWVIWAIALPMVALELYLSATETLHVAGTEGLRQALWLHLAFFPDALRSMWAEGYVPPREWLRLISYPLIHGSLTHVVFVVVILLALGKFVGEVFRWWAVVVVVLGGAVAGAVASTLVPFVKMGVFGGYPAVYGLIGAFTFVMWVGERVTGGNQIRAFALIGFLLAAQTVFGMAFGGGTEWVADLAAFGAGFTLSFAVNPAGWAKLVQIVRGRA